MRSKSNLVNLSKLKLRQEFREKRSILGEDYVIKRSLEIAKKLKAVKEFKDSKDILLFLSLKNEVQTGEIIKASLELGKRVYVPIVNDKSHQIMISELPRTNIVYKKGAYGIREPIKKYQSIVSPARVSFVVVPGLVFDFSGGRIGFGGGYYDYFLKGLSPYTVTAGVAFNFQVMEAIPLTENDVRVQKIITEEKTINC